uniref:Uncharacterized protein n=1 Tax=Zea mays TaxID=4577 RepID=C0PMK5_MAIZE|nr:unknown [Zea mays]
MCSILPNKKEQHTLSSKERTNERTCDIYIYTHIYHYGQITETVFLQGGSWGGGAAADHLLRRESGRLRQVPLRQGQGPAADREPAGGRRRGERCRCRCRCPYAEPA